MLCRVARLRSAAACRTFCAASAGEPVLFERASNGVCSITLNAPKSRNALSRAMIRDIAAAVQKASSDDTRVLVLRANGPAFSAGHDLKEVWAMQAKGADGKAEIEELFTSCSSLMLALEGLQIPVLAAVRAQVATAAGAQLVATCDMVYAARSARFATPGVKVGVFCSTPAVAVARNLPPKVAAEALFTGRDYTAAEMAAAGLVTRVFEDADLDARVGEIADEIATRSGAVLRLGKRTLRDQMAQRSVRTAYEVAGEGMACNLGLPDSAEGVAAFVEKRHPRFTT